MVGEAPGQGIRSDPTPRTGPQPGVAAASIGSLLLPERLGIWTWVLGYTAILTTLSVLRYHLWLATGFDLGMYEQALWLIWHHGLLAPSSYTGHPLLGLQASCMLLPLAVVYHFGGTGALLALQAFALGIGYGLLRDIGHQLGVPDRMAHLVGAAYLLYPVVLGANLFDFHPVTLAVPLLLAGLGAALRHRPVALGLWLLPALLTQDSLVWPVLLLAVALLGRRQPRLAVAALVSAGAVAAVDAFLVLPHLGGVPAGLWPAALLSAAELPAQLGAWTAWMGALRSWEYIVWIVGPLAGILVLARRGVLNLWWLPALAVVAAELAQGNAATTSPFNQWSLPAVPFLFVALLCALVGRDVALGRRAKAVAVAPVVLFAAVFAWHQFHTNWHALPAQVASLTAALQEVKPAAAVVAQNFALARVADRQVALLPAEALARPLRAGTFVLLDPHATTGTTPPTALATLTKRVSALGHAKTVFHQSGITLLQTTTRVPPLKEGAA